MNKELNRIINESSSEELCEAQRTIAAILESRRNKAKEEAWLKIRKAIADYSSTFGVIEVESNDEIVRLNSLSKFDEIGKIVCTEDW